MDTKNQSKENDLLGTFPPYAHSRETVSRPLWDADDMRDYAKACVESYVSEMHELCMAIEALPASEKQTALSMRAAGIRHRMASGIARKIPSGDVLTQEISAHEKLRGTHARGRDFEDGFIAGLRHVRDNIAPLISPNNPGQPHGT